MIREGYIFKIALFLSTALHLGGFGLFISERYPFFQNGFGSNKDNVIVFEMGTAKKVVQKPHPIIANKQNERCNLDEMASSVTPLPPRNDTEELGFSGLAKKNHGGVIDNYLLVVRRSIEREKYYPREAKRRLITGSVRISFYIDSNGILNDISIIKSSGYSVLDNTTREIVLKASPFPKLPEGVDIQYVQTTIVFCRDNGIATTM